VPEAAPAPVPVTTRAGDGGGRAGSGPAAAVTRPAAAVAAPRQDGVRETPKGAVVEVPAPLPGVVLEMRVERGVRVGLGDVLLTLEAMKMENEITAPADGTVAEVRVHRGDTVSLGDVMITLTP
jgi:biotin carboxyl carrier protein